jgi:hypothetical protein
MITCFSSLKSLSPWILGWDSIKGEGCNTLGVSHWLDSGLGPKWVMSSNDHELDHNIGMVSNKLKPLLFELRPNLIFVKWRQSLFAGDCCNRTDQIIKSTSTKTSTEVLKFSNLSPYNPGSQSKPRRISNQLAYNQDRIIQHTHHTLHFTSSSEIRLHPRSRKLL